MRLLRCFRFTGPNWHTDFAACEWLAWLDRDERKALRDSGEILPGKLADLLQAAGVPDGDLAGLKRPLPINGRARFAFLLNTLAVVLQRHAGHKVRRARRAVSKEHRWVRAIYEVENVAAGEAAGRLALRLLARVMPELKLPAHDVRSVESPSELISRFRARHSASALPRETRALIQAAKRHRIPCLRLDRLPPRFRWYRKPLRAHGGLLLGQGVHRHIVDGTLCLDRGAKARLFLHDRLGTARMLATFGAPLPHDGRQPPVAQDLLEAVRIVERLGYPVDVKPVKRTGGTGVTRRVRNLEALMQAIGAAQAVSRRFLVQPHVRGRTWRIIVSNDKVVGVLRHNRSSAKPVTLAPSTIELAQRISQTLDVGLLVLTVVARDIRKPLVEAGGAVVELDLAPDLDHLLKPGSSLWKPVMNGFVRWLYPADAPSRIPLVAVTGTSGQTTTCRMIEAVMRNAGFETGLSCSDGLYLAGTRRQGNRTPVRLLRLHRKLLRNPATGLAILEFPFAEVQNGGFPFDQCAIGVVTNVTADPLQPGWETEEQCAEMLRAVPQRAIEGVVLNADDRHTAGMLARLGDRKLALTSVRAESMNPTEAAKAAILVSVSPNPEGERIVIRNGDGDIDLMGVAEIPAIYDGLAQSNVENALQAIAAALLLGIPHERIRAALAGFRTDFDSTPGRPAP